MAEAGASLHVTVSNLVIVSDFPLMPHREAQLTLSAPPEGHWVARYLRNTLLAPTDDDFPQL